MKKGNIYINNGLKAKVISKEELQTYLDIGWVKGNLKGKTSTGKIWIYNLSTNDQIMIDLDELDHFMLLGYIHGHKPHTEETKRKLSEYKGEKHHMFGKHYSDIARQHMSEALKNHPGHKWTEELHFKFHNSMLGHKTSEETKLKISKANKGKPKSDLAKLHMSETRKGKPSNRKGVILTDELKKRMSDAHSTELYLINFHAGLEKKYGSVENAYKERTAKIDFVETAEKIFLSKIKNGTTNTSKPEEDFYKELVEKYGEENVKRNYNNDPRYPWHCDFYIIPEDKFIELNLFFTHGYHQFNKNDEEDLKTLNIWQEKAKTSKFYENAIKVWTQLDPLKILTAINNNLNYEVLYPDDFK